MWLQRVDKKHAYLVGAAAVLGGTTLWWSWLGAGVQQGNADQLVDGFLFESSRTFHAAYFPGSHTQLLKWPLFYLVKLLNYSSAACIGLTVLACLLTVGALAFLLSRVEKRPLVLGSLFLLLAAVLFAIPAQIFPGSTSPFNMAMLTTRNLEYIIYIGCLYLLIKSKSLKNWQFGTSILLLVLLFASDKLFVGLSVAGAVIGVLFFAAINYLKQQKRGELLMMARWLAASIAAFFGAAFVLWILNHFTHIVNDGTNIYGWSHTWRAITQGSWQAVVRLISNFGANWLVGLIIMAGVVFASYQVVQNVIKLKARKQTTASQLLALMLLASTITALILFAGTQQAYELNARYLTIGFFAGFVTLAVYIRDKKPQPSLIVLVGLAAIMTILFSIPSVLRMAKASKNFNDLAHKNQAVVAALKKHPVDVLVGNYWRVVPIKSLNTQQVVAPLISCTQLRGTLTSKAWQPQLPNDSFAYLLSTILRNGFPYCTQAEIIRRFGKPLETQIISGTAKKPEEMLLFYNLGQRTPQRNTRPLPFLR